MVNRVKFLAQISTLSYIVKNFKLGFLKKGSPKKFETQDLKWSLSTCKKLLKHFFSDIFLFQDISEDRCGEAVNFVKGRPFITTNFKSISNYSNMNQDICLKFFAFVYLMSVLN